MPRVRLLSLTKLRPRRPHFWASSMYGGCNDRLVGLFARNQGGSKIENAMKRRSRAGGEASKAEGHRSRFPRLEVAYSCSSNKPLGANVPVHFAKLSALHCFWSATLFGTCIK